MEDIKFSSINELYNRLLPALKTRKNELKAAGIYYVKTEDIWNYLKEFTWKKSKNLTLYEMVGDILSCEKYDIDYYVKNRMKELKREINPDESIL